MGHPKAARPAAQEWRTSGTRTRREILDAIGYVLRSGCAWRCIAHDFPPWQTV
jgi:transposase